MRRISPQGESAAGGNGCDLRQRQPPLAIEAADDFSFAKTVVLLSERQAACGQAQLARQRGQRIERVLSVIIAYQCVAQHRQQEVISRCDWCCVVRFFVSPAIQFAIVYSSGNFLPKFLHAFIHRDLERAITGGARLAEAQSFSIQQRFEFSCVFRRFCENRAFQLQACG